MSTATLPQARPVNATTTLRDVVRPVVAFFLENPLFTAGVLLLLGLYLSALVGLLFINPKGSDMGAVPLNLGPSAQHLLGTDGLGRDMVAVMVIGIPNMFKIGFLAGAVGVLIGAFIGLFAGYYRGLADSIFSSFADVMLVIPSLAVLITVSAYVRVVSVELMAVIVGLLSWPLAARVIRAQTLSLRERLFVQVARLSGENDFEIITRQILPNVTAYLAASFVGAVSGGILASVGLEVLGLGPQNVPTIGRALYYAFKGSALFKGMWWWWAPAPVVTLAIIFTGLFWISLSLDKYANPRLKVRGVAKRSVVGAAVQRSRDQDAHVLDVRDLRVTYQTPAGPVRAVNNVTFFLRPGERFGLVGESGSGKTTTALSLMRLLQESAVIEGGEVFLDGVDLLRLSEGDMRQARFADIALVPQGAMNSLNPMMKIGEQLRDTIRAHRQSLGSGLSINDRIAEALQSVELDERLVDSYPHELSGGMKQRVCIAMAILLNPKVIIADEPTSALDVVVQRQVMETLRRVQQELGAAVILVGHDMGLMAQFVNRVGVMYGGKLVEVSPVRSIFKDPQHPYTQLLIKSLPNLETKEDFRGIPGLTPSLLSPPSGCMFHPRCPQAMPRCSVDVPVLTEVKPEGWVSCHLYDESPRSASLREMQPGVKSLLEAQNVTRIFGGGLLRKGQTVAVDGVSLIINEDKPSITTIAGESGSGKTTLARLLLGLIQPTTGSILYRGEALTAMDGRARKNFRREVQAIFQDPYEAYNPVYKVDQTLTTPVRKFRLGNSKEEAQQRIEDSLRMAGLRPEETLGRYPHQLSGGQRQRIMVARALLLNPRIILADEPVSMVDASLRATILESLVKLKRELGISLVYITHDLTTAYQVSQNIYILYRGSVAEVGSVAKVIKDPKHPYTRLLVNSIPLPDPDLHWGGDRQLESKASTSTLTAGTGPNAPLKLLRGCKFANRCPYVMAECHQAPPPLYRTDDDRAVACYLHKDSAQAVSGKEMAAALAAD